MSMDPGRDFKAGERASRGRAAAGAAARERWRAADTGARSRVCGRREPAHHALKAAALGSCLRGGVKAGFSPRRARNVAGSAEAIWGLGTALARSRREGERSPS